MPKLNLMAKINHDEGYRGSAEVSAKFAEIAKVVHHKNRQSHRKANKLLKQDTTLQDIGKFYYAKTNIGLAPFNERSGTTYLLPANSEVLAVNMKGWTALYITRGMIFDSIEDVKAKCPHIRGNNNHEFKEFRRIDKPVVFRDPLKVAAKKMAGCDKVSGATLQAICAVYVKD